MLRSDLKRAAIITKFTHDLGGLKINIVSSYNRDEANASCRAPDVETLTRDKE